MNEVESIKLEIQVILDSYEEKLNNTISREQSERFIGQKQGLQRALDVIAAYSKQED
ncbi:MAG: hypothetical protein ACPG5Z_00165 [Pseudoalteromonas sp.]